MNCVQFEQQVNDLALERVGEAALDEALAHTERCAGCARMLADSRALRSGLRALAEGGQRQAPPRLEAMLLAAFRRERRAEVIRVRRARWARVGMAAAAAVLVALAVRQWRAGSGQGAQHSAARVAPAQSKNAASEAVAASAAMKTPASSRPWPRRPGPSGTSGRTSGGTSRKAAPRRRATPEPQKRQHPASSAGEIEWATDFLPLPYAGDTASADVGELIRIDLPRSALTGFALPSAEETAGGTVTAQVLIGEDGVARAIRFAQ